MTILVAPDSFKGTYSALEVAVSIAAGIEDGGGRAVPLPVADGGEGTFDALCRSLDADAVTVEAVNAWAEPISAILGLAPDGTAVIEVAQAGGLTASRNSPHDAMSASTYGTGMMIAAAIGLGATHVMVAAGGSATTDGGAGAVRAINDRGGPRGARLTVLSDVTTTFLDAPRIFGPQKGADAASIQLLEERLQQLAVTYPRNPAGVPRTGAAGGLSGGLWANFGADLVSGADAVLDAANFDKYLESADAVVVGEGRLDSQTGKGKIISAILHRVRLSGRAIPVLAIVGSVAEDLGAYAQNFEEILVASDAATMYVAGQSIAGYSQLLP
ncbi:glycerate kinase [Arthrobacter sp. ov118]|uniref:glycerate kinase family protein n=1 Tax=Arthrobacter sp. ov118 TaxID=1761747 RepID=UPI0008E68284|nr:glycerate kinase [Arthrobacter sp. ov118]SFU11613.1 glycerate kinase [Arthrobacter sp. ov118]